LEGEGIWDGFGAASLRVAAVFFGLRLVFTQGTIFKYRPFLLSLFLFCLDCTFISMITCPFSFPGSVILNIMADLILIVGLDLLVENQVGAKIIWKIYKSLWIECKGKDYTSRRSSRKTKVILISAIIVSYFYIVYLVVLE
jgi:hypothetical protein